MILCNAVGVDKVRQCDIMCDIVTKDKSILNDRIKELESYIEELNKEIIQISEENKNYNLTLNSIYNSRGWKLLEKARKITGKK